MGGSFSASQLDLRPVASGTHLWILPSPPSVSICPPFSPGLSLPCVLCQRVQFQKRGKEAYLLDSVYTPVLLAASLVPCGTSTHPPLPASSELFWVVLEEAWREGDPPWSTVGWGGHKSRVITQLKGMNKTQTNRLPSHPHQPGQAVACCRHHLQIWEGSDNHGDCVSCCPHQGPG